MASLVSGESRRVRKQSEILTAVFTSTLVAAVVTSLFTNLLGPLLLVALAIAFLFAGQLANVFLILFPVTLLNPLIRIGLRGVQVQDERSFSPLQLNLTELFIVALLLSWFMRGRSKEGERVGASLNIPLAVLFVMAIGGIVIAVSKTSGVRVGLEKVIEPLVLFFVVTHTRWDRAVLRKTVYVMVAAAAGVALKSVFDFFFMPPPPPKVIDGRTAVDDGRLRSYWAATNAVSAFFGLLAPAAFLHSFYSGTVRGRVGAILGFGSLALALAVAQTRTAWLAIALVLLGVSIKFRRGWLLLILTGVIVGSLGTSEMLKRASSLLEFSEDVSFQSRLVVWGDTVEMIGQSPLLGIGFGSFTRVYRSSLKNVHPHNDWLNLAVDMGALAPLLVGVILVQAFAATRRALRLTTETQDRVILWSLGGGIAGTLMQSQLASLLNWSGMALAFWFLLGLQIAYARSIILDSEHPLSGRMGMPRIASGASQVASGAGGSERSSGGG